MCCGSVTCQRLNLILPLNKPPQNLCITQTAHHFRVLDQRIGWVVSTQICHPEFEKVKPEGIGAAPQHVYSLSLAGGGAVACSLSIDLSAGDVFEVGVSEALEERVVSLRYRAPCVRRPVPQHEEEVRDPGSVSRRQRGNKVTPI